MAKADQSWPLQAFIIGSTVMNAMSAEEVHATFRDMEEAGIAKLPYPRCDVIMPPEKVLRIVDKSGVSSMAPATWGCTIRCRFEDEGFKWLYTRSGKTVDLIPADSVQPQRSTTWVRATSTRRFRQPAVC